ncbi:MAG: PrsW family glutamic-type intramembrane protease [Lachnospiraceae bacterium]|nr:PrsW family glutamic-type intramembrane protease [Lachnospiraceae bacterium]MDD4525215.1 PrsW family glutamic-type intramembrane protease [Lachnospiraceae bacterium]
MFFVLPGMTILTIYMIAAVGPAIALLIYVYRQDKVEQEPIGLVGNLMFKGVLAALCSIVLESIGEAILPNFISEDNPAYSIVLAFIVVAVVEEGTKFFFLQRRTWNDPNFNYRFDGIVYAVSVSLGFAAFENIEYVFGYGLPVAPARALLAIPGHMGFAVFMGVFYGRAKLWSDAGYRGKATFNKWMAYLSAVFFHGFYDSCAMIGNKLATVLFIVFVIVMYIVVFNLVKHESLTDEPV